MADLNAQDAALIEVIVDLIDEAADKIMDYGTTAHDVAKAAAELLVDRKPWEVKQ